MMTPQLRELIARAIDGSLHASEKKAFEAALQDSAAARELYASMKRDAIRLKSLPTVNSPVNIAENVMDIIRERNLSPIPAPPAPKTTSLNWSAITFWLNVATAAGVFMTVGIGSYLYFAASVKQNARPNDAGYAKENPKKSVIQPQSSESLPVRPATSETAEEAIPDSLVKAPSPEPTKPMMETNPPANNVDNSILTARPESMPEISSLNIVKHRVSKFVNLADLIATEAGPQMQQAEIRKDLKTDELIRLDLFCKDPKSAMELLNNALKAKGCQSVTDQFLLDRLKKKQTTEIVFFTDVFNPEEVFQFLTEIARTEKKSASGEGEFDTLVIAPFLPADLQLLNRILGVSSNVSKLPKPKTPVDIRKPLPEGTANQLAQNLSNMGGTSTPKKSEKLALIASYSPINLNPSQSKEIRQYLERRSAKSADAKPMMLVLRTVN